MGCHFSSEDKFDDLSDFKNNSHEISITQKKAIDNIECVIFEAGNLVNEKMGKISKDYTLLNPPLGRGSYGEVRKAIHKTT